MNKITKTIASLTLGIALIFAGCMTSKVVTPGVGGASATTNIVVNTANLTIDALVVQNAVAVGFPLVIQKDPSIVPPLKDAVLVLNLVLNGATTNSLNQVLAALGKSPNTNLSIAIAPYIGIVNTEQQALLAKYGTNVAPQIILALAQAVDNGLTTALAGK